MGPVKNMVKVGRERVKGNRWTKVCKGRMRKGRGMESRRQKEGGRKEESKREG